MKIAAALLVAFAGLSCSDPASAEPDVEVINQSGAGVVYSLVVDGSLVDPVPSFPFGDVELPRLNAGESHVLDLTTELRDEGFTIFAYFPRPAGAPTEWRLEATLTVDAPDIRAGADVLIGDGTATLRR